MKKSVLAMFLLVLIVGLVAGACGSSDPTAVPTAVPVPTNTATVEATQPPADGPVSGEVVNITLTELPYSFTATVTATVEATQPPTDGPVSSEVVNITLTENPWTFQPDGIDLKVGTTYALTFNVPGEFHTFTVDDLDLDISISAGEQVVFEFTPTQAGTFELICLPHEGLGMVGEVRISS